MANKTTSFIPLRGRGLFRGTRVFVAACVFIISVFLANSNSIGSTGVVDGAFRNATGSGLNGTGFAVAIQPDGKILAGGAFREFDGESAERLVRLLPDGTLDDDFMSALGSGFDAPVHAVAVQTDGRIVVGGAFTEMNGKPVSRLVRLHSDGTFDDAFQTALEDGPDGPVYSIVEPGRRSRNREPT